MNIPTQSSVILTEHGVHVPAAAMASLPIDDSSSLWGAWIQATERNSETGEPSAPDPEAKEQEPQPYQLIMTPLPPDTWPVSFCLQLQLSNEPNSFAFATRVVHALRLNVVSVRSAPAGFKHTTFTLVCEAPELRRRAYHHTRSLRHSLSQSRVNLLRTGPLWPTDAKIDLTLSDALTSPATQHSSGIRITLNATQETQIREAHDRDKVLPLEKRSDITILLLDQQLQLIRVSRAQLPIVNKEVSLDACQVAQLLETPSGGTTLSPSQCADLFLVPRATNLTPKDKDKIWRDFAFVLAEKLLIRMHEALWCLRLVSHLKNVKLDDVDALVGHLVGNDRIEEDSLPDKDVLKTVRAEFASLVRALKFVLDRAGEDNTRMGEHFGDVFKKDPAFMSAWRHIRFITTKTRSDSEDDLDTFSAPNKYGFLHYRFLYGLDGFLVNGTESAEIFSSFVGSNPIADESSGGGQSLQRILNGIKRDGEMESVTFYEDMIGDLIDRSNELTEYSTRIQTEVGSPVRKLSVHQKLTFLLSTDARRRTAKAADGRLLVNLIYLWIRVQGDLVRVREFKYNRDRQLLVAPNRTLSETLPNNLNLSLPSRCTLSIDPLHCVAKLFPASRSVEPRLVRLIVEYEVMFFDRAGNRERRSRSSAGILDLVNTAILTTKASIRSYSNQIRDRPRHLDSTERPRDRGIVSVELEAPPEHSNLEPFIAHVKAAVTAAFSRGPEESDRRWQSGVPKLVGVSVTRNWLTQVFISSRFNDEFWKVHVKKIRTICKGRGFEPIVVEDPDAITDEILEKIKMSHCFLQIIPIVSTDEELSSINLSWLHGEYMCAAMQKIPSVRAVQVDRNSKAQDWLNVLKVGSAQSFETFSNSTELLTATLPRMLERLRRQVAGRT